MIRNGTEALRYCGVLPYLQRRLPPILSGQLGDNFPLRPSALKSGQSRKTEEPSSAKRSAHRLHSANARCLPRTRTAMTTTRILPVLLAREIPSLLQQSSQAKMNLRMGFSLSHE